MRSILFVLLMASGAAARAEVDPALARDIEQRVLGSRDALAAEAPLAPEEDEAWYLRMFWLRVRARIGWSLPGLVNLQVIPEFEMIWLRDLPAGWSIYKPPADHVFVKRPDGPQ